MTLQHLNGLTKAKHVTREPSVLEYLFRIEERVLEHLTGATVPEWRTNTTNILTQALNEFNIQLTPNHLTQYLLVRSTQEQPNGREAGWRRGYYTSALRQQLNQPYEINLQDGTFNHLFDSLDTKQHTTIRNANGDLLCWNAGGDNGHATIQLQHCNGQDLCRYAGSDNGHATIQLQHCNGTNLCWNAGWNSHAIITGYDNPRIHAPNAVIATHHTQNGEQQLQNIKWWRRHKIKQLLQQHAPLDQIEAILRGQKK